jgi:hypothetical protein
MNRDRELCQLAVEVSIQLIDHFLVAGFVVDDLAILEVVSQPFQKVLLGLARYRDLADALLR